ncbi:uncharacterized protein LOC143284640 [Babylonia areolata]|uniref:uncharacterized protein LOC143284640 n=1 Tax=Babylonia areolata TaxID=304850 RepID=UPI003FD59DDB
MSSSESFTSSATTMNSEEDLKSLVDEPENSKQQLTIAVGVLAGIIALFIVAVIVFCLIKKCRGTRNPPSDEDLDLEETPVRRFQHHFRPRSMFDFLEQKLTTRGNSYRSSGPGDDTPGVRGLDNGCSGRWGADHSPAADHIGLSSFKVHSSSSSPANQ